MEILSYEEYYNRERKILPSCYLIGFTSERNPNYVLIYKIKDVGIIKDLIHDEGDVFISISIFQAVDAYYIVIEAEFPAELYVLENYGIQNEILDQINSKALYENLLATIIIQKGCFVKIYNILIGIILDYNLIDGYANVAIYNEKIRRYKDDGERKVKCVGNVNYVVGPEGKLEGKDIQLAKVKFNELFLLRNCEKTQVHEMLYDLFIDHCSQEIIDQIEYYMVMEDYVKVKEYFDIFNTKYKNNALKFLRKLDDDKRKIILG